MRKILFFLLFSCNSLLFAQGKVAFQTYQSWDQTKALASQSGKKILLYFGAPWCAPCNQIKRKILPDVGIQTQLKVDFVTYDINIDDKSSIPFLKKYRISGVPLIIVLNSDGFVTNRISEIPMNIADFSSMLKEASSNKEYIKGITNSLKINTPRFYDEYFDNGMKKLPDSTVIDSYLKSQTDLSTEVNWNVLTYFSTNDEYFYYIKENDKRLVDKYGMEVKFQALAMYRRIAQRYIDAKDSVRYNQVAKLATGANDPNDSKGQRAYLLREILFLGRTGMDWHKFIEKSELYVSLYGTKDNHTICQYGLETKPSIEATNFLKKQMQFVLASMPYADSYYMYGSLLWYSGERQLAEEYFQKTLSASTSDEQIKTYNELIAAIKAS